MKKLKGTGTEQNLINAFAGESQARNRYTFYAKAAKTACASTVAVYCDLEVKNEK